MEAWIPLISVVIGGLVAVIPVLITMRNQSKERDKDRQEKRRDARTQAMEKSLGGDIDKVLELLANLIKALSENSNMEYKFLILKAQLVKQAISEDEFKAKRNALIESNTTQTEKITTSLDSMSTLIYSFDDEISSKYDEFISVFMPYIIQSGQSKDPVAIPDNVLMKAGSLQQKLRYKKISIYESLL
jgi:hypothetical protein